MEAPSSFSSVYIQVVFLLACFNLLGLATGASVVRGNDTDQQALLHFKAEITGDQLGIMESWNSSIHFCQWRGVTCSRKEQRVTKLELQSLKLSGSLSPYIGNLSFLEEMNLAANGFYDRIPQEIGRLRRLDTLELTNNSISGEIPSNLSACSKLTTLNIRGNQLTGEIPALLGHLSHLEFLNFVNNSLTGIIPASLGNLSSLVELSLTLNELSGTIPEALGQLKNLSFFSVAGNEISGVVPVTMFNLSTIVDFDIGDNKIQGTLHSDLEINMPQVEFFSVAINQISGQIPLSISNASYLDVLQFAVNRLSGNVPSLEKLDKLFSLKLNTNHLGNEREGDLNFLCTLVNNTKLENLYLGGNNFAGVFPRCISNFSRTLSSLAIDMNKISGGIPDGIANLINLEILALNQNQLSGPIPFDIGRLQNLNVLYANNNFLSGTIPNSFGNLTLLTRLTLQYNILQGTIPSSLGNCRNLLGIDLSHNNFSGPIPPEVLGISSMSIIVDLSSNNLTGELPASIENMINLGELHVSNNRLSGLLPIELGSCVSLQYLLLDGNVFEGPIPSSLSSMKGLVALDVSNNNLSGGIPEFLVSFLSLKYLNLSFNDFEGSVPSEGVFKNASATFVEGNNKLCGGIPELHLSGCNSKMSKRRSKISLRLTIGIVVVILGVTLVFTCLLILWFRKKKEQQPMAKWEGNLILPLSYPSILRATDGFSMQNFLGSGSFGSVYKGILEESGATIAVKVLNLLNHRASMSFLAECEALKNIRHRNLIKILTVISGVDFQGNDFKALVYEFMVNGSLEEWLHPSIDMNNSETMRNLSFIQRVNVTIDVAHALEYLHHHCELSIIHCDLKPSNILLDAEMVGHLSDFGLAKILSADDPNYSTKSSSIGLRGTIGYAPPEYGIGVKLSTKGDVYSYGILLLEIFIGKRPTHDIFKQGLNIRNFVVAALPDRVTKIIDPILLQEGVIQGTLADASLNGKLIQHMNSIFEIGLTCSVESPTERLDMSDVVPKLCSIRDKLLRLTLLQCERQTLY